MTIYMQWIIIKTRRHCVLYLTIATITSLLFGFFFTNKPRSEEILSLKSTTSPGNLVTTVTNAEDNEIISAKDLFSNSELRIELLKKKVERLVKKVKKSRSILSNSKPFLQPNYNIHIFYYAWYGNKDTDGYFKHWNHNYLPNWKKDDGKRYPTGFHLPPYDIGSNYFPALGCYSSNDQNVIDTHMKQLKDSGIGVMVVSWSPPKFKDSPHKTLPLLFDYAKKYKLKIALHVEPYADRNPINLREHLRIFMYNFGNHPALYKIKKPLGQTEVPVIYIYDSYLTPAVAWKELLSAKGNLSIRGKDIDAIFIGLLVEVQHRYHIKKSHFDGFYTYFTVNGFSYGSTWKNWKSLSKFAVQNGLIFVPSVGPGYIDTQVRPWNSANTRHRRHGQYYDVAWRTALSSQTNYISITSFNEWHEGTQIEPAVPKTAVGYIYLNYEPEGSYFYLNLTKRWIEQFNKSFTQN